MMALLKPATWADLRDLYMPSTAAKLEIGNVTTSTLAMAAGEIFACSRRERTEESEHFHVAFSQYISLL